MIRLLAVLLSLAGAMAFAAPTWAEETVAGAVSYVSEEAVEVGGRRALVTSESLVVSNGRAVSLSSLRRGMPATAEIDDAGRLIELRVNGVVE